VVTEGVRPLLEYLCCRTFFIYCEEEEDEELEPSQDEENQEITPSIYFLALVRISTPRKLKIEGYISKIKS
jgi:hypothetical protein